VPLRMLLLLVEEDVDDDKDHPRCCRAEDCALKLRQLTADDDGDVTIIVDAISRCSRYPQSGSACGTESRGAMTETCVPRVYTIHARGCRLL
jgi:hypothetical protein